MEVPHPTKVETWTPSGELHVAQIISEDLRELKLNKSCYPVAR